MITKCINSHTNGATIKIRVSTRSSRLGPLEIKDGSLKWGVNAAPVDGKANQLLIAQLAKFIGTAKSNVVILKGEKSKDKIILIYSIDAAQLAQKLDL